MTVSASLVKIGSHGELGGVGVLRPDERRLAGISASWLKFRADPAARGTGP